MCYILKFALFLLGPLYFQDYAYEEKSQGAGKTSVVKSTCCY